MDAQTSDVLTTVFVPEVSKDYEADMNGDGVFAGNTALTADHRYGTAALDGIAFGPKFGSDNPKLYLTIAYSIYPNPLRSDNNHQVLLQYDVSDWGQYQQPFNESVPNHAGPAVYEGKYFVLTGNQVFGVQNLEYDQSLDLWLFTTYPTLKILAYPLYTLFAISGSAQPTYQALKGVGEDGYVLPLAPMGRQHLISGVRGWLSLSFGIEAMGGGLYYLAGIALQGGQGASVRLARWTADTCDPWESV
jgi:hypothetical protein